MSESAVPGGLTSRDPDLSERQRRVFLALLALHARTARPVGSETLSDVGVAGSPATIRAALAELEARGLLARAHSSAGRTPSALGYAFYVRSEITPLPLPGEALRVIDERLRRSRRDVEQLLHEAARLLAELTFQLGLALATSLDDERVGKLELTPDPARGEPGRHALLVLSLGVGVVRTLSLELESPLPAGALTEIEAVLRERLCGLPLSEVRERLARDPELVRDTAVRLVARAAVASWVEPPRETTPLFMAGAGHIAAQPEFASSEQLASLLRVVEEGPPLDRLMVGGVEGQPIVRVALDEAAALSGCSLVHFPLPGKRRGGLGVLGPLRMDYARALGVVDAIGSRVAAYL
jgi:heat-inducible transcriptional repressor